MTMFTGGHLLLIASVLLIILKQNESKKKEDRQQEFIISGYWRVSTKRYDINATAIHLTTLILHSIDPTFEGDIDNCCLKEENYQLAQQAKAYKKEMTGKDLRIWIAVGGWGRPKQRV